MSIRPIQAVKSPSLTSAVSTQPNRTNGAASGLRPNSGANRPNSGVSIPNSGANRPNSGANRPNPGDNSANARNTGNPAGSNAGANSGVSSGYGPRSTLDGCPRPGGVRDGRGRQTTAAGNGGACCVMS